MATIYALVSNQGTAMSETAACKEHLPLDGVSSRDLPDDWNGSGFEDCSLNESLSCQVCGATAEEG